MDMVKRAFLRACINHSCLEHELIEKLLTALCKKYKVVKPTNKEAICKFVHDIEKSIKDLNQSLSFMKHPITRKEYLVFAITDATPDKCNPGLTPEECLYFSIMLDKLGSQEDCYITWNNAYSGLDFQGSTKQPKKSRLQSLLQVWTEMGYFLEMDDNIYLGPRSLIEFEFYLRSNYPETIKECSLCKQLVLWDIKCSDCGRKIHRECIKKYLRTRSNCPSCKKKWSTRLSQ